MSEQYDNPIGLDGFEFIEFASPDPDKLERQFSNLGFVKVGNHKSKDIALFKQGQINFLINREAGGQAENFTKQHGPGACAMGFRVNNANDAYELAVSKGAKPYEGQVIPFTDFVPVIEGIGGSIIYFIDKYDSESIYDTDFEFINIDKDTTGLGLTYIDHLTHNLYRGNMDKWAGFYESIFNFREIRFFDIQGKHTGLVSRALSSPCNKIRIPLNEAKDDKSQIEEFVKDFNGEGIQHIALGTDDIYKTVELMRKHQVDFMDVPDTYFEMIEDRLPKHGENLQRLHNNYILIDGTTKTNPPEILLQIFTKNLMGPVFFEIIQRKGDEGFGEGNFQALFESIERDQIKRGVV